jgi:hypothetical protein
MKKFVLILCFAFLILPLASAREETCQRFHSHNHSYTHLDDVSIDADDNSVIIRRNDHSSVVVKIKHGDELYIDGRRVELDRQQQKLVRNYYELALEMTEYAKDIGLAGAEVGLEGAQIGLKAAGKALSLIFTDYDEEDLERELKRETRKIEAKAAKLEDKADKLEDMASELEDLQDQLKEGIPALDELDWF